jgi:hypothetical protein
MQQHLTKARIGDERITELERSIDKCDMSSRC